MKIEDYTKLKNAFYRLQSLYIVEVRSNPKHIINDAAFKYDWDEAAGLLDDLKDYGKASFVDQSAILYAQGKAVEPQQEWIDARDNVPPVGAREEKLTTARHPEDYCHKCGRDNPRWYAPNEIFNAVNGNGNGIMCPICFLDMAKEKGLDLIFTVEYI